jgi:hypothetical protein
MIDYIILPLIIGALVNGIYIVTEKNMAFYFVREWLNKVFVSYNSDGTIDKASKWYYPVLYCPRCMPSLYGPPLIIAHFGFHVELLYQLPITLLISVTAATIIHQQYD